MKIICVTGGSYKSFYLNYLKLIKKCDLLVFNYGIIYNLNKKDGCLQDDIVKKELLFLARKLSCVVVAGVIVEGKKKFKNIICCDGEKLSIYPSSIGIKISFNSKQIAIGDERMKSQKIDKIVLTNKRIHPNARHCSKKRTYIFCDNFGLTLLKNKKITRNFNKYSKIILK